MTSSVWGLKRGLRTKSEEGEVLCVQGQGAWGWRPGSGGVWTGPDCGFLGLSSRWFEGFLGVCVGLSAFFFILGMQGFFSLFLWIFSLS